MSGYKNEPAEATRTLREGFTTGTAATAAAMAALECLLDGTVPTRVDVPLPPFSHTARTEPPVETPTGLLSIPVETTERTVTETQSAHKARASVLKDGGDDPDATHGARIVAEVAWEEDSVQAIDTTAHMDRTGRPHIRILGGKGVGRVTLPGLPVAVGKTAINPVPRQQMAHGLRTVAARHGCTAALRVTISVPEGEALAQHTFNARLGIVGGISILGTQGTVKPYSHAAWKATIRQGLDVAEATGCTALCLSTGRRSEKLLLGLYPQVPTQAAVQVADFAEYSLREAGARSFSVLVWGCFFGKLVKLAQGHGYTHARSAELDFALLARWCAEAEASPPCVEAIAHCVTANHALDLLLTHEGEDRATQAVRAIALKAATVARQFAGLPEPRERTTQAERTLRVHVFHLNGKELVRV